jgi:hypothetical protein
MTISIGLIPNDRTVMLIQDSEMSFQSLGFTQDIINKIKQIDDNSMVGVIGNPLFGNEVIEVARSRKHTTGKSLRDTMEDAYHLVRDDKIQKGVLRQYGLSNIRQVTQPEGGVQIDSGIRNEIIDAVNGKRMGMSLDLMLASNYKRPELYTLGFPGVGRLQNDIKMYDVSGSGSIMAIEKLGEELEKYRWEKELSIDEGIDVLMRAGKASEKHEGVGGPFDITYVTREKGNDGKVKVIKPDQKKINMVMYLLPLNIDEQIVSDSIAKMRDVDVSSAYLSDFIKTKVNVGIEFDRYFGIK